MSQAGPLHVILPYRSAVSHYLAGGGVLPADEPTRIRALMSYAESLNPRTLALRLTALGDTTYVLRRCRFAQ